MTQEAFSRGYLSTRHIRHIDLQSPLWQPVPPVPESAITPAVEVSLTRKEKEQLLQKMYFLPHWIAVVRLLGYKTMHMDEARKNIKPLADEYGKEPVASACEVLVEIFTEGKETFARLKSHIRRMAFQMLGPEPTNAPAIVTPAPEPRIETPSPRPPDKKKPRHRTAASAPPPAAAKSEPAPSGRSAIMEQYRAAKEKHPEMLLLFRCGDFYELFGEDAETAHKLLGLTLTTRDRTLTMAGFPYHQLETYLHKLLKEGQRVAVCDPVDESLARGPIRREVTRVVTPCGEAEEDVSTDRVGPSPAEHVPVPEGRAVKQPRHFVLKQYEAWMNDGGLAFVAIDDVKRTTPAVAPYVGSLDFIVLRGDTKLLVTVRPFVQAKHLTAIGELQKLFGPEYRPVRVWPTAGPDGWNWQEFPVDASGTK